MESKVALIYRLRLVYDAAKACNEGKGGNSQSFKKVKNRSNKENQDDDDDDDESNAVGRTSESIRVNKKSRAPESIKKKSKLNRQDEEKQINTEEVNNFSSAWEDFQSKSQ